MNNEERYKELLENRTSSTLHINRLPVEVKKEFKEFAKKEFCNDFGFAFKHIWDFYKGIVDSTQQEIIFRIDNLEEQVNNLNVLIDSQNQENAKVEKESKQRKSISGKPLGGIEK